ncbi:MAG TPA: nicotinic acid mononucleotide adenylyltransferase [Bacteroidales bacterium]|nr:nicotinic acid mononucleotide adenylyltransferase [Bacteroidales bacterium]
MAKEKQIGLFFGSFNPIHNGHLMIANWMVEYTFLDQVWFVVSPLNPFKKRQNLLADYHRIELVNIAINDYPKFKASNIETKLPQPSYTIDSLAYITEQYPDYHFTLIMGSDQLPEFHRWKNADQILANYRILVYPRMGDRDSGPVTRDELLTHPSIEPVNAPIMEISSSFIRNSIKEGKDVRFYVPTGVWEYMVNMHFYE